MIDSPASGLSTLAVVLLPTTDIGRRSAEVSHELARHGTEFILQDGQFSPHLSLYMGRFDKQVGWEVELQLGQIAKSVPPPWLTADRYTQDLDEGMIEVSYAKSASVTRLQDLVVSALNPLRCGLRPRDPVGRVLAEWLPTTTGEVRGNLERYGYDEIGGQFRPHITFTRFTERNLRIDVGGLPPLTEFTGLFPRLGLFEMAEHGTCTRRLVDLELGGAGSP
jgi:hypothetical protein